MKYESAIEILHQMRNKEFNWNLIVGPSMINFIKNDIDLINKKRFQMIKQKQWSFLEF